MMNTTRLNSKKKLWAVVALVLSFAMLICVAFPGLQVLAEDLDIGSASTAAASEVSPEVLEVYENGTIKLRSYEDLVKVGTGDAVKTADGTQVYDEAGYAVTYALDATYTVAEDIAVPAGKYWRIPSGFTGRIASMDAEEDEAEEPATVKEVEKAIAAAEKDADDHPLYDADTNAILIYNPYQLVTLAQDDAAGQPVMTLDWNAATYGMGELVYGADSTSYLTYDPNNNYIITTEFDSATPTLLSELLLDLESEEEGETSQVAMSDVKATLKAAKAPALGAAANVDAYGLPYDGRDYGGQVVTTIGDTDYILLGSKAQLQALDDYTKVANIDQDQEVFGPIWTATVTRTGTALGGYQYTVHSAPQLIYPGDADIDSDVDVLNTKTNEVKTAKEWGMTLGNLADGSKITSLNTKSVTGSAFKYQAYVTCDSDGTINYDLEYDSATDRPKTGKTYSPTENYIVFRDIDLEDEEWTPLMFYGNMYGTKLTDQYAIRGGLNGTTLTFSTSKPEIQNITVNQTEDLNVNTYVGVGFFATLMEQERVVGKSINRQTVHVKNIQLETVRITNTSSKMTDTNTLLNLLLPLVGEGLGLVLKGLLKVLSFGSIDISTDKALRDLLETKNTDPSNFATGALAGRVVGNVVIEDCVADDVEISSADKGYDGGMIGYSVGKTQYDGLSNLLGDVVGSLALILNIIPWLGLGDLITILLENAVTAGALFPTSYDQPVIKNTNLNSLGGTIGTAQSQFNGGFIGYQCGTRIEDSSVTNSSVIVKAANYGGGFAGLTRDGEVVGLLDQLGLNLINYLHPQSVLFTCSITDSDVSVAGGTHLGGFVGTLCEGYAVNCTMSGIDTLSVIAADSYAGGFCGYATIGWLTNLGSDEVKNTSLLSVVKSLLTGLLSKNASTNEMLLTLAGAAPSAIMGTQMNADQITVKAKKNCAGGIIGLGDGVYLTKSSTEYLEKLPLWANLEVTEGEGEEAKTVTVDGIYDAETTAHRFIVVQNLESVTAGESYAGGIAGVVNTANGAALLNDTVGLAGFIGFTVDDVTVTGINDGFTVEAGESYAAGGLAQAIGGTVNKVRVNQIASVTATKNYAGGFIGRADPSSAASTGGLSVNLLGLDRVLSADNLLNIGSAMQTKMNDVVVTGITDGFTVEAKGQKTADTTQDFQAGGFIAEGNAVEIEDAHVINLKYVKANNDNGQAGGFVGKSTTGDLADVTDLDVKDANGNKSVISASSLLSGVSYLIPVYNYCDVTFVKTSNYVEAAVAGGFAGEFLSGKVNVWDDDETKLTEKQKADKEIVEKETRDENGNNPKTDSDYWAVKYIDAVNAQYYGGGFAGILKSGALATAGKGISILGNKKGLNLNIGELVSLVNSYIPIVRYAGVWSDGFTVTAKELDSTDLTSGAAGGYVGLASGAQISYSDVYKLKHTTVTPPTELEAVNADSYFDDAQSKYAVTGGRYAGGYAGLANVGSAASVSDSLGVLGDLLNIGNLLKALNVVVTTIEHSNVTGGTGGYAVLATQKNSGNMVGDAGGFAGEITGAHIQDSNSYNFCYIIGEETAGGYVGYMHPGSVADAVGNLSLLGGLVAIPTEMASLVEDFVATIRNSETTCIPCGGAVRAHSFSDATFQRGCAGGYCGYNEGGQIWGNDNSSWKDENEEVIETDSLGVDHKKYYYNGPQRTCSAIRILSVYGAEFAGGFTGLMTAADTADTGSLSVLWGLIEVNNLLSALSVVYATEENTAIYGPLSKLDIATWEPWITYVGQYGGFGQEFKDLVNEGSIKTQEDLDKVISKYIYGYTVVAGRTAYVQDSIQSRGGCAGGYIGSMTSGVITNGQAYDAKKVVAMKSAGGYVGEAQVGGAAALGSVSVGGLNLDLSGLLGAVEAFVPVIKTSSVRGYKSGLTVTSTGTGLNNVDKDYTHNLSNAGGYIGYGSGIQIWGDATDTDNPNGKCDVKNLLKVNADLNAGGYAGQFTAGSVLQANTSSVSTGFVQDLLNSIISTPSSLLSVAEATVSTVRNAHVSALAGDWGYTVEGLNRSYANLAGGFVGNSEAAIIGDKDLAENETSVSATGLRGVAGGEYAGGFFGLGDINGVANVAKDDTSILSGLLNTGEVSLIDAFKTYIYHANVNGVADGYIITANAETKSGIMDTTRYTGCAGGFGGGLMNGTVTYSDATNLNAVSGLNYNGGFIGHMGRSGVVTAENIDTGTGNTLLKNLIGANANVLNVFGAHAENCSVTGISDGYTVSSHNGTEEIAGGFVGYADLSRVLNSEANMLKYVMSDGIAGGFAGRTTMAYLVSVEVNGYLAQGVTVIVNTLLEFLYLDELENLDLISLGKDNRLLGLALLSDGDLLYVNLLGLRIGVSLSKNDPEYGGVKDAAIITIGDSNIKLPVNTTEDGKHEIEGDPNIEVNLIKGNRTKIVNSKVTGVTEGYDVYGGKATYSDDATEEDGYAGGFVGYNDEGKLQGNEMIRCDTIKGTSGKVGPFTGKTSLQSVYSFNTLESIEGSDTNDDTKQTVYNVYHVYRGNDITNVNHMYPKTTLADWQGDDLGVYISDAKAVLMDDTPLSANTSGLTGMPTDMIDPCIDTVDITITKKWQDNWNISRKRPDQIKIQLWQKQSNQDDSAWTEITPSSTSMVSLGDESSQVGTDGTYIIMDTDDDLRWSAGVWEITIKGLPVSNLSGNDIKGGQTPEYYYEYKVTEADILDENQEALYVAEITPEKSGYVDGETTYDFTITNRLSAKLPSTGGRGVATIIILGCLIVALGMLVKVWREEEENGGEAID